MINPSRKERAQSRFTLSPTFCRQVILRILRARFEYQLCAGCFTLGVPNSTAPFLFPEQQRLLQKTPPYPFWVTKAKEDQTRIVSWLVRSGHNLVCKAGRFLNTTNPQNCAENQTTHRASVLRTQYVLFNHDHCLSYFVWVGHPCLQP